MNENVFVNEMEAVIEDFESQFETLKAIRGKEFAFLVELSLRMESIVIMHIRAAHTTDKGVKNLINHIIAASAAEIPSFVIRTLTTMSKEEFAEASQHAKSMSENLRWRIMAGKKIADQHDAGTH